MKRRRRRVHYLPSEGMLNKISSSEVGFVLRSARATLLGAGALSQPGGGPIDRLGAKTLDEIAIRLEMAVIW